jgi:hypothetical protein
MSEEDTTYASDELEQQHEGHEQGYGHLDYHCSSRVPMIHQPRQNSPLIMRINPPILPKKTAGQILNTDAGASDWTLKLNENLLLVITEGNLLNQSERNALCIMHRQIIEEIVKIAEQDLSKLTPLLAVNTRPFFPLFCCAPTFVINSRIKKVVDIEYVVENVLTFLVVVLGLPQTLGFYNMRRRENICFQRTWTNTRTS